MLKSQLDIGIQHGPHQSHRQAGGHVTQVGLEINPGEADAGIGLAALRKRRGLRHRVKTAAIELEGQLGLGLHLTAGIQVAQKRHGQGHITQLVRAVHGLVRKIHRRAGEGQVEQRKLWRVGRRLARGLVQALQNVVNVVFAIAQMRQVQVDALHRHGIDHGRPLHQRLQCGIQVNALDAELGLAIQPGHGQVAQFQLQRPGLEVNLAHSYFAAQGFTGDFLQLALQNHRHQRPAQAPSQGPQHPKSARCPEPAPRPLVLFLLLVRVVGVHPLSFQRHGANVNGAGEKKPAKRQRGREKARNKEARAKESPEKLTQGQLVRARRLARGPCRQGSHRRDLCLTVLDAKDCLHESPGPLHQRYPGVGTGYCRLSACFATDTFSLDPPATNFKLNF